MSEETKHTDGPWMFDEENHGVSSNPCWGLLDAGGRCLHVHVDSYDTTDKTYTEEIAMANARLIAAAPAMADALALCDTALGKILISKNTETRFAAARARVAAKEALAAAREGATP